MAVGSVLMQQPDPVAMLVAGRPALGAFPALRASESLVGVLGHVTEPPGGRG